MGQALYRKYRSKTLDEIVGQPHITITLSNALKSGAISHAYLFTGPRGTGKTSIARILAHEVNSLPYSNDTHLDIIEIDAASNRRIDEIRELRERVHTAPTSAKYKVYIIDEVHMLTKEAFNALLKTLEEPPAHVIFILATTEAHKLPETIVSRTQRFTFKPVEESQVIEHLSFIAKEEGADIETEALRLIAQHGGGSFRDSISLLDQVRGQGDKVTLADVQTMLGIAPDQTIDELISVLQSGEPAKLVQILGSFREQGYQASQIAKQLAARLRGYLLEGQAPITPAQLTVALQRLLDVTVSHDQEAALEIALLDIILSQPITLDAVSIDDITPPPAPKPIKPVAAPKATEKEEEKTPKPIPEPVAKPLKATTSGQTLDTAAWSQALQTIKNSHNTLYSVARMAEPRIEGDELVLVFGFAFHQKRLDEVKNKQVIADIVEQMVGHPVTIKCIVEPSSAVPKAAQVSPPVVATTISDDTISTISNIFGGAEVLES